MAWELGSGRGHALTLASIAATLREGGCTPVFAALRPDTVAGFDSAGRADHLLQAPIWPGLFATRDPDADRRQATLGDLLADLGLKTPTVVRSLVSAWEEIFRRVDPAAIVADYAPAALLAARGRLPAVAVGNGFTLPPADTDRFARIAADEDCSEPKYDESALLETIGKVLGQTGRTPLTRLPQLFAADRSCVATFVELDPYAATRRTRYSAPFLPAGRDVVRGDGRELFVYLSDERLRRNAAPVRAISTLAGEGLSIRAYIPGVSAEMRGALDTAGVKLETTPLSLTDIARSSRLILSHGSLGMVSAALAAGIPQIVIPFDGEKRLIGQALERLGVGRSLRLQQGNPLEPALLAAAIRETIEDEKSAATAKALAPSFANRLMPDPAEEVAAYVRELL